MLSLLFLCFPILIVSLPACKQVSFHELLSQILQIADNPEIMSWETAFDLAAPSVSLISPSTQMKCHK